MAVASREILRSQFPSLQDGAVFLENAGGSQVPQCVIDAVSGFYRDSYVQTGVGYPHSERASQVLADAHAFFDLFFNAGDAGTSVIGPSATQLLHMLGGCVQRRWPEGGEIVVSIANHEANSAPWALLEDLGFTIKWWGVDPETGESSLEELASLLSEKTRLVAFPHVSNLLGHEMPVRKIADLCREAGAWSVCDSVAFAPHSAPDVQAMGVDFCLFSCYKVYGPHLGAMFGRSDAWAELVGPNHFFVPNQAPGKFEIGCVSYEGCAAVLGLWPYLELAAGRTGHDRATIEAAFAQFQRLEEPLTEQMLAALRDHPKVRIIGHEEAHEGRHPTISFLVEGVSSSEAEKRFCDAGVFLRHGHMYSRRLCEAMGINVDEGVVRVSAVHLNDAADIKSFSQALSSF